MSCPELDGPTWDPGFPVEVRVVEVTPSESWNELPEIHPLEWESNGGREIHFRSMDFLKEEDKRLESKRASW